MRESVAVGSAAASSAAARALRPTRAEVNLAALRRNVNRLTELAAPAELWVVVKANAYGHGALQCARQALAAGARGLCVALVQEAVELREAGITSQIMVLSEQSPHAADLLVAHDLTCVVYNQHYIAALSAAATRAQRQVKVHLKIDTGMHRAGVDPAQAVELARHIVTAPGVVFEGVMTHLATADDPHHPATQRQLAEFEHLLADIRAVAPQVRHVHSANSAAMLRGLAASASAAEQGAFSYTMVRAGISAYGLSPGDGVANLTTSLEPVLRLRTEVSHVRRVRAGEGVSYGLRTTLDRDTTVATLPLGYADGISRRAWQTDARVLVGGRRRRILGVVTMDQMMVDCADDTVQVGDEAVIIGTQGTEQITAEDWARALDTITYEVVCDISSRVPRTYGEQ